MPKFSLYEYEILEQEQGWVYEILDPDYKSRVVLREAGEWYDSYAQANLAAIGHISLLENGEG